MQPKVILINPPYPDSTVWVREGRCQQWDIWGAPFPPLSLALISTQLRKTGIDTRIIDGGPEGKGIDAVVAECAEYGPALAILSTVTPCLNQDLGWFAPRLKAALPGTKMAAIGVHVSALPVETMQEFGALDFAIAGEPEETARELAESVCQGAPALDAILGLAWRDERGEIRLNPPRPFALDIDAFGLPDWGRVNLKNYPMPIKRRPFSLISFSRGCPYRCKFCCTHVYNGGRLRKRSVESLIAEIEFNLTLGVRDFLFWTELMTLDREFLDAFLEAIFARGLHRTIEWVCNGRTDCGDGAMFEKMARAGCWQIALGFEFGDDRMLEVTQKAGQASREQGTKTATLAHQAGIAVDGHFLMGYPGETERTLQATIDYACSMPLTFAHFYPVVPFPGSQLYEEVRQSGLLTAVAWDRLNQDKCALQTDSLSPETVNAYISRAYRRFYLNPKTVVRALRLPKRPKEYLDFVRLSVSFYRRLLAGAG